MGIKPSAAVVLAPPETLRSNPQLLKVTPDCWCILDARVYVDEDAVRPAAPPSAVANSLSPR